jgi:hypothetical protein
LNTFLKRFNDYKKMKKLVLFIAVIALISFSSCKKAATEAAVECAKTEVECEKPCEKAEGDSSGAAIEEVIEVVEAQVAE